MTKIELDHLVIAADSLDQGRPFIDSKLGVDIAAGGEHLTMGTHNLLMGLSDAQYLEVIAISPDLPKPDWPRWFALDKWKTGSEPRLITWVARTDSIEELCAQSPVPLGEITTMSRGNLTWRIAIPIDGSLVEGGILPMVIEWPEGVHPTENMADQGVSLDGLVLSHPEPKNILAALEALGIEQLNEVVRVEEGEPGLKAKFMTPSGPAHI